MDSNAPLNNINSVQTYEIELEVLKCLFDPNKIEAGDSGKQLRELGGSRGLKDKLVVNEDHGLSNGLSADLQKRKEEFGDNTPIEPDKTTIWELTVEAQNDEMLKILILAAILSQIIGIGTEGLATGWYEGTAILVAVIIITVVTVGNNYVKEQQFQNLFKKSQQKMVNVIRDGRQQELDQYDLLVGDVLKLETGQEVPVDCLLLKRNGNFLMDESATTGESRPIKKCSADETKPEMSPFVMSGTQVQDGDGYSLVCCVGESSRVGQLKNALRLDEEPTPLQKRLEFLGVQIGKIGTIGALLAFLGCFVNMVIRALADPNDNNELFSNESFRSTLSYIILAITIIVMAVPEGLPMAVTIAQAFSVESMRQHNNLVRHMSACETMSSVSEICSDKTGTQTQNRMKVQNFWISNGLVSTSGNLNDALKNNQTLKELTNSCCTNSTAAPLNDKPYHLQNGNRTELAQLEFAKDNIGMDWNACREKDRILRLRPFSSERKRMSCLYRSVEGKVLLHVKGAPEALAASCEFYKDGSDNKVKQISDSWTRDLNNTLKSLGDKKARTIGVAYKEYDFGDIQNRYMDEEFFEEEESRLVFLGVFGVEDPIRVDVPDAIKSCHAAGVRVRMVTGDNTLIATAIAKECGILDKNYNPDDKTEQFTVLEGKDFREYVGGLIEVKGDGKDDDDDDDEDGKKGRIKYKVGNIQNFVRVAKKMDVLARSLPEDKLLLVTGLQEMNKVVAVTGDGTNDAPALKKSNVGFAMGKMGTDVAKDASKIVLLDDSFTSIITAIKFGRNVFDAIRKFVQFQQTVNVVAMATAIVGGLVLEESPINPIQMLWLNVIMDSFAALALATDPPAEALLFRAPNKKFEMIITVFMWKGIIFGAICQFAVLMVALFGIPGFLNIPNSAHQEHWTEENGVHYTLVFNIFIFLSLFNFVNARVLTKEEKNPFVGICQNWIFWLVIFMTFGGEILFIQYGGKPTRCSPLPMWMHGLSIGIGALSLVFGYINKLTPDFPIPNWLTQSEVEKEPTIDELESMHVSSIRKSFKQRTMAKH